LPKTSQVTSKHIASFAREFDKQANIPQDTDPSEVHDLWNMVASVDGASQETQMLTKRAKLWLDAISYG
jgi:hypothetical protein